MISVNIRRFCSGIFTALGFIVAFPLFGGFQPGAIRVEGLPEDASKFWSATQTKNGWVAASSTGAVEQQFGQWVMHRSPGSAELKIALPYVGGIVCAGTGFCGLLLHNEEWRDAKVDENFRSGVVANAGQDVFVSSRRSVYHFHSDGRWEKVYGQEKDGDLYLHTIKDKVHLFAGTDVFVFEAGEFRSVGKDFPWARGPVAFIAPLPDGGYMAAGRNLSRIAPDGSSQTVQSDYWNDFLRRRAPTGIVSISNDFVIASYLEGILSFSLDVGKEGWRLGADRLGGNVWSVRNVPEGLIVGGADGLYVVPDPTRYQYAHFKKQDIYGCVGTSEGPRIVGAGGVLTVGGQNTDVTERTISMTELETGEMVYGGLGARNIRWGEKIISLESVREVTSVCGIGKDAVAAVQPSGTSIVRRDGRTIPVKLPATSYSVAAIDAEKFIVGTTQGAYVVNHAGEVVQQIGKGLTFVKSLGSTTIAFDASRRLMRSDGEVIGVMPFAEMLDIVQWKGAYYAIGRFSGYRPAVGRVHLETGAWEPLDLPLTSAPVALGADNEKLYVVSNGVTLAVTQVGKLAAPDVDVRFFSENEALAELAVPADKDSVQFTLPRSRLAPWDNPRYSFRVGSDAWIDLAPGSKASLPRLAYGDSEIVVRGAYAGLETTKHYVIHRVLPWWRSAPGYLLYAALMGGLFWSALVLRTRRLKRKALDLEAIVASRTEELRRIQSAREKFFSMLNHEIRNPMNGVVGICNILAEQPFSGKDQMFVRTLRSCAVQLQRLLNDMLDMTKANRGELPLRSEAFDLAVHLRSAALAANPTLSEVEVETPYAVWVTGDPIRLQQVTYNLVSNALKFGQPAHAVLRLNVIGDEPTEVCRFEIVVRNSGPEIPAVERESIFEAFNRGRDSAKSAIPGTGLGLAVSRKIIEAMGGVLDFRRVDGFTEFYAVLSLPHAYPSEEAMVERASFSARVLAVEDESYNRLVLGHTLGRLGIEADWATDVDSARRAFAEQRYDMIITDFRLPDGDGVSLSREFSAKPGCPPIIMLTAYSTDEKRQAAHDAGVGAVLTKPLSEPDLVQALRDAGLRTGRVSDSVASDSLGEFDFTSILALQDGKERLAEYCADLERQLGELNDPAIGGPTLGNLVHSLRGRLALVSGRRAAAICEEIESACSSGARANMEPLIQRLGKAVDEVARAARERAACAQDANPRSRA